EAQGRQAPGHLRRPSALLLRPGQEGRRRERARLRPLRRSLVGRLGRRQEGHGEAVMEFLVEFNVEVPDGTAETEVEERKRAEAVAAAELAAHGHLLRLWRPAAGAGDPSAVGIYAADSQAELDSLL